MGRGSAEGFVEEKECGGKPYENHGNLQKANPSVTNERSCASLWDWIIETRPNSKPIRSRGARRICFPH